MLKAWIATAIACRGVLGLCGCPYEGTNRCEVAANFCSAGQSSSVYLSGEDVLTDPYRRRALGVAAAKRFDTGSMAGSKRLQPLWDSGLNVTRTEAWSLIEHWRSEQPEIRLRGGMLVSGSDALVVFGSDSWFDSCDRRHVKRCFPLALSPALHALQRRPAIDRLVLVGTGDEAVVAFHALLDIVRPTVAYVEDLSKPLDPINHPSCVLLCPTLIANIPMATYEASTRAPFVGAQYVYVPLPGALERMAWLLALSSVVLVGSWQGKYQLTLS